MMSKLNIFTKQKIILIMDNILLDNSIVDIDENLPKYIEK